MSIVSSSISLPNVSNSLSITSISIPDSNISESGGLKGSPKTKIFAVSTIVRRLSVSESDHFTSNNTTASVTPRSLGGSPRTPRGLLWQQRELYIVFRTLVQSWELSHLKGHLAEVFESPVYEDQIMKTFVNKLQADEQLIQERLGKLNSFDKDSKDISSYWLELGSFNEFYKGFSNRIKEEYDLKSVPSVDEINTNTNTKDFIKRCIIQTFAIVYPDCSIESLFNTPIRDYKILEFVDGRHGRAGGLGHQAFFKMVERIFLNSLGVDLKSHRRSTNPKLSLTWKLIKCNSNLNIVRGQAQIIAQQFTNVDGFDNKTPRGGEIRGFEDFQLNRIIRDLILEDSKSVVADKSFDKDNLEIIIMQAEAFMKALEKLDKTITQALVFYTKIDISKNESDILRRLKFISYYTIGLHQAIKDRLSFLNPPRKDPPRTAT